MAHVALCKSKNCPMEKDCIRKKSPSFPSKMWDYPENNRDFMGEQKLLPENIKEKKDCRYFLQV